MAPHPRISLNSICSMQQSFDEDLALWADLGIDHVGLISPKLDGVGWDVARQAVLDRRLRVSSMSCYPDEIARSLDFSAAVGSEVLYLVPGSGGSLLWEEAAEKFCVDMAPYVARA